MLPEFNNTIKPDRIMTMAKTEIITSNAVSNCSQGTASQFGYAFWAADSLYAPRTPWNVVQIFNHL